MQQTIYNVNYSTKCEDVRGGNWYIIDHHLKQEFIFLTTLLKIFKGTLRILPLVTIQSHS